MSKTHFKPPTEPTVAKYNNLTTRICNHSALAIAIAMSISNAAIAQEASDSEEEKSKYEQIVVTASPCRSYHAGSQCLGELL